MKYFLAYLTLMKVCLREKLFYGVGNLGYATVSTTLSNFIMFFGTSVLGISGTLVGLAVSLSVLWDAISDPIVGYYSDNLNSPMGKRHPFMLIGILGMCAVNLLIWLVPQSAGEMTKFFWILLSLLAVQTFCTFFSTPHLALGLEMTDDPHEQTSIQCWKTIFFLLGMMLPSVFMFVFMPSGAEVQGQLMAQGYIDIAYASSLICLFFGLITFFGTLKKNMCCQHKNLAVKKEKLSSVFNDFFNILRNKKYRVIILGYSVSLIASSILTASGMHMFTYCFHFNSQQLSIVMVTLLIGAIISQVVWEKISRKIGKKWALIRGLSVGLIGILLMWGIFVLRGFLPTSILMMLSIPCMFVCGFGTGVLYSFPISIFSDVMAADVELVGKNKAGTYSGIMTLAHKISNAISLVIIGVVLDVIKFSATSPVQPLAVQNGLGMLVILGTVLSLGISILIYNKF